MATRISRRNRAPRRYNFRGNVHDGAYFLIHDWFHNEGYEIPDIEAKTNLSRTAIEYALDHDTPPSMRAAASPPPLTSEAKKRIAKRRKLVKKLVETKKTATGTKVMKTKVLKRKKIVFPFGSPGAIAREITATYDIECSAATVSRDLTELGYRALRRRKTPYLTEDHKVQRVAFAKSMLKLSDDDLLEIVFSDEKWFDSNDSGCDYQWCKIGERPEPKVKEGQPPRVHVWGCVGRGGKRKLIFLPQREQVTTEEGQKRNGSGITAEKYQKLVLSKALLYIKPGRGKAAKRRYQQDGARCHIAKSSMAYLSDNGVNVITNWPPYSPDLNVIENVWSLMSRAVSNRGPWGVEELEQFVQEEWEKISDATINDLLRSFKSRLQRCVELKGAVVQ